MNGNPPPTGDGAAASARPPLPSCPFEFWPQQYAAPRVVIPQVNLEPALSDLKDNAPKTGAGLVRQSCGPVMSDQVHRSPIPVRYPVGRHGCLPSSGRAPYGMYRSGLRGSGPGQVGCVSTIPTSGGRNTALPSPRCPRSWCSPPRLATVGLRYGSHLGTPTVPTIKNWSTGSAVLPEPSAFIRRMRTSS